MIESMFKPVQQNPNFPALEEEILRYWEENKIFEQSLEQTKDGEHFTFYEGPPTANGVPGIHHVESRSFKDLFPRFKTMQGYYVARKAGWDTHGLPVELQVEKLLGLGSKREVEAYGIEKFNAQCRESVFTYEAEWRKFTSRMAYWVNLDQPYMTLHKDYIESIWWSVAELQKKGLLYKGFRVAPYCPKDGTTLSNAEVSDGYKEIQDPSVYITFKLKTPASLGLPEYTSFLVWTTTPWTLPYNVGVVLHPELDYVASQDEKGQTLILAASLKDSVLGEEAPIIKTWKGHELEGVAYEPLFTAAYEAEGEEKPIWHAGIDTYVSDSDGTGIVHTAPAFGEDDMRVSRRYGWPVLLGIDPEGKHRFGAWEGQFFRDANTPIMRDLKARELLWREKNFLHSYPHCWRCGTPLMYYATESWYLSNTSLKERLIELNEQIDWHPAHIKHGRYGGWLENLIDWNISRNRYWGTPLPIWEAEDGEYRVVGSYAELAELSGRPEILSPDFDPHRPFIDDITFEIEGKLFKRVPYVMDVWYDSGAMPFAQHHYPFENKELFEQGGFPADYISEAIDQTRGWFNSLHQIGTMVFDSIAYRSVICAGHFLDEKGQKMSKSKGNVLDPWQVFNTYGADAARWYTYVSAPPELSRRVGMNVIGEAFRGYFLTLWNTYSFFVMYANLDKPDLKAADPVHERPEVDRWLIAKVQELIRVVTEALNNYDPTTSSRALQEFVSEDLSNWYVRRNRRRFWGSEGIDHNAYATLHYALVTVTKLTAPFTPFIAEQLWKNLVLSVDETAPESVHLSTWPTVSPELCAPELVDEMEAVMRVVGLGRTVRGQTGIRQRQPLPKVLLRARSAAMTAALERFSEQIKEELNVKEMELLDQYTDLVGYTLRPNLPLLGKKWGKAVPQLRAALMQADTAAIARAVRDGKEFEVEGGGQTFLLTPEEVLVDAQSPEGYAASEENGYLVAFDITLTHELELEGLARDLVRGIQDGRKKAGFEVSDRIRLTLHLEGMAREAAEAWRESLMNETLATELVLVETAEGHEGFATEIEGGTAYLVKL